MMSLIFLLSQAQAGGLGITTQNGLYQNKAYYYRSDGKQGFDSQMSYSTGLGVDVLLGNRSDRLQGILRLGWSRDFPASNPEFTEEEGYEYTFPEYDSLSPTDVGVTSIGLQWTLLGDPTGAQLMATTSLSSAFWTPQSTEYFLIDVGLGGSYTVQDRFQTYATINFAPRYRKSLSMGINTCIGARILFD